MIKAQVISSVAKKTGISKADVKLTIETLFQVVQDAMTKGESIHFRGFGNFANKKRARKVARNITKNTALVIEERYVPTFTPSKAFSEKIKTHVKV